MSELRTNRIVPRDGIVSGASGGIIQVVNSVFDSDMLQVHIQLSLILD